MVDVKSTYMGIDLKNPIIAGASRLTANMDDLKRLESAGAGAVVLSSLFEEQIQLETQEMEDLLTQYDDVHAEMASTHPAMEHGGPGEHLIWIRKAKADLNIPVIASLNAVSRDTWLEYAKLLAETGVDGLELNFYSIPVDPDLESSAIEEEQIDIVGEIRKAVSIPISVKLSAFYANPLNVIRKMDEKGAHAFVLFNRFLQSDINVESEREISTFKLSSRMACGLPLRFAALLHGRIAGDVCCSSGIARGEDVAKMILGGAQCVQVVGVLFQQGVDYLGTMLMDLRRWMDARGYGSLDDFRGKLDKKHSSDPYAWERAQYVRMLLKYDSLVRQTEFYS